MHRHDVALDRPPRMCGARHHHAADVHGRLRKPAGDAAVGRGRRPARPRKNDAERGGGRRDHENAGGGKTGTAGAEPEGPAPASDPVVA